MTDVVRQIAVSLVVPFIIGFAGAMLGAYVAIPVLDVRVTNVEKDVRRVEALATKANDRINFFHAGG
jgi:hypothetical protein